MTPSRPYHHGNLRPALVAAATEEIEEVGAAAMSLRQVAARVGVSHAAASHHFGDKTGLVTAVAVNGHRHLAEALAAAAPDLLEMGVAYVRFAGTYRGEFSVMFRPEVVHADDPELVEVRAEGTRLLGVGAARAATRAGRAASGSAVGLAAWSLVHGFATLWVNGGLPTVDPDDLDGALTTFRAVAATAFRRQRAARASQP
jgi:AcrR family transcriptional regulator